MHALRRAALCVRDLRRVLSGVLRRRQRGVLGWCLGGLGSRRARVCAVGRDEGSKGPLLNCWMWWRRLSGILR
jgi:hypothetical protein